MCRRIILAIFLFQALMTSSVFAKIQVNDVLYSEYGDDQAQLIVKYSGKLPTAPTLDLSSSHLQIVLDEASVWPKINKKVAVKSESQPADLMAYQYDKNTVRVRAYLPYKVSESDKNSVELRGDQIVITFPRIKVANKKMNEYDEKYLDSLLKDKPKVEDEKIVTAPKTVSKDKSLFVTQTKKSDIQDHVNVFQSSTTDVVEKKDKSGFSFAGYIGKFIAFLGLVLLLFYGLVTIMKKGVLSKGKLGFLNKTQVVTVLNTTYLGPKRSIIMVKVHDQIFMLGSSEAGITMLSEIENSAGLLKEGERAIAGNNFDTTYGSLENLSELDNKIKLKDQDKLSESAPSEKSKVKFSDKVKEKVKTLKPLH